MQIRILIVHPSRIIQAALSGLIEQESTFKVVATFDSGRDFIQSFDSSSSLLDLVLLDPTLESPDLVTNIKTRTDAKVILLALDDESPVLEAWIKEGIRGILGPDATPSLLIKAFSKIYAGEFWFSRALTQRFLSTAGVVKEITPEQALIASLTAKEKIVIEAIFDARGQSLRDTAKILNLSEHTLRNHLASIYSKLGVANRLELFVFTQQHLNR